MFNGIMFNGIPFSMRNSLKSDPYSEESRH
jgi:hypothetical protein